MPDEANNPITSQVRALAALGLDQLRAEWRHLGYGDPPKLRSAQMMRRLISWRLQAAVFGDLDAESRRLLRVGTKIVGQAPTLRPGSLISREYLGVVHRVRAEADGFHYDDRLYRSLSEVAREITGVRWNGPRFFGLRVAVEG